MIDVMLKVRAQRIDVPERFWLVFYFASWALPQKKI